MAGESVIVRLAKAIGYPDEVPRAAFSYAFKVDDYEISATLEGARLLLRTALPAEDGRLVTLAGYAAGRLGREETVLAWDPKDEAAFLWRSVAADAGNSRLRESFEGFAASCDWWRRRLAEFGERTPEVPEMVIRP